MANPICDKLADYSKWMNGFYQEIQGPDAKACSKEISQTGPQGGQACKSYIQLVQSMQTTGNKFAQQTQEYSQQEIAKAKKACPESYQEMAQTWANVKKLLDNYSSSIKASAQSFAIDFCAYIQNYNQQLIDAVKLETGCAVELQSDTPVKHYSQCAKLLKAIDAIRKIDKDEKNLVTQTNFAIANQQCPDTMKQTQVVDPSYRNVESTIMKHEMSYKLKLDSAN